MTNVLRYLTSARICLACMDCLCMNALGVYIVFMSPLQMRRSSPLETLDVIMPQAGCCVAVGLEYRCIYIPIYRYIGPPGVGTPVHLGLSVSWIACTACYNNIVQLGCRLIA